MDLYEVGLWLYMTNHTPCIRFRNSETLSLSSEFLRYFGRKYCNSSRSNTMLVYLNVFPGVTLNMNTHCIVSRGCMNIDISISKNLIQVKPFIIIHSMSRLLISTRCTKTSIHFRLFFRMCRSFPIHAGRKRSEETFFLISVFPIFL